MNAQLDTCPYCACMRILGMRMHGVHIMRQAAFRPRMRIRPGMRMHGMPLMRQAAFRPRMRTNARNALAVNFYGKIRNLRTASPLILHTILGDWDITEVSMVANSQVDVTECLLVALAHSFVIPCAVCG